MCMYVYVCMCMCVYRYICRRMYVFLLGATESRGCHPMIRSVVGVDLYSVVNVCVCMYVPIYICMCACRTRPMYAHAFSSGGVECVSGSTGCHPLISSAVDVESYSVINVCVCMYVQTYICMYRCACMYESMHICIYP